MRLSRRSATAPFIAMDILAEAGRLEAGGRDIVHMEVGEPAYGAPRAAREALAQAKAAGEVMGYTSGLGIAPLRVAIAMLYRRRYGIEVPPDRVVVTAGSSAGFILAFLALFDPGARVGLADPGYPAYRNILATLGLEAVRLEAGPGTRFQPSPALMAAAGTLDGLIVASPSNPSGTMLNAAALGALIEACHGAGTALIADEIYHGISYDAPAATALAVTDEVFVMNSFSKYWAMTGWRIGWMVVPERFVRPLQNLAQNLFICAPHASQVAALGALSEAGEAEAAGHLAAYRANRARMIEALRTLGFTEIAPADGAFYAYATLPEGVPDSMEFCRRLLGHHGVAATPGLDFDPVRGHRTVRFSYAQAPERIAEGCARLAAMLRRG